MSQPEDPIDFVKRLAETHRQIRLGRGVVGKTSHATLGIFTLWGIVLFRLGENVWLNLVLIFGALVASGIYRWWVGSTQKYAKENPGLALLEGAELLEYQRFEAQAKGLPNLPNTIPVRDPTAVDITNASRLTENDNGGS